MPDPNHLRILEKGVKAFNDWREKNPFIFPNIVKANLSGADLSGADLRGADLRDTDLRQAIFELRYDSCYHFNK